MRILVLLSSLFTGGAEFSTLSFYGWLRRQPAYEVKVVCYKKARVEYKPGEFGFDDVIYLRETSFSKKKKELQQIVSDFKPQLIHSILFEANILGRFIRYANPSTKHMESLVNEVYSPHRLRDPNVTWLKLKGYQIFDHVTQRKGVDHYHANSHAVAEHYRSKILVSQNRVTIVPRGREKNSFVGDATNRSRIRSEFGVPHGSYLVVNVGRHEYQKGQDVLLESLSALSSVNYKCVIVGRDGSRTNQLKEMISGLNLNDKVILAGHRTDVNQILAASDLFVFPSRFEGLPGSLIEAEAAGLPIVCTDIPNNREVATGDNATFFPVDDAQSFATLIKTVLTDEALRLKMGTRSMEIFNKYFTIETVHAGMKNLVDSFA